MLNNYLHSKRTFMLFRLQRYKKNRIFANTCCKKINDLYVFLRFFSKSGQNHTIVSAFLRKNTSNRLECLKEYPIFARPMSFASDISYPKP